MAKIVAMLGPDTEFVRARTKEFNDIARTLGGGVEFRLVDTRKPFDDIVKACEGVIALHPAVYRQLTRDQFTELAKRTPSIKLLQTPSAGTDVYDKHALAKLGVQVCNHGGANAVAVAEIAITLMVGVYRKLVQQIDSVRAGTWSEPITSQPDGEFHTLVGKRVGIVGLGRIGSRVARRLQGWECEVVYHDIVEFPREYVEATKAKKVDFETLLKTSDIVSLHVPLDPPTRHLMSEKQFALMKPTAMLINTCRGPVVDEAALIRALEKKVICGAGLDVTEIEPVSMDNPLLKMSNVILTPHQATRAIESLDNAKRFVVENIDRLACGKPVESVVPPI